MPIELTREDLFRQVWERPMTKVAADCGVSGTALKKICFKYGIPVPDRGHWAKVKAGKAVVQISLPPRGPGVPQSITIGGNRYGWNSPSREQILNTPVPPYPKFSEPIVELEARVRQNVTGRPYPKTLEMPHREIAKLLKADEERRKKQLASSYSFSWDAPIFESAFEKRRLKLLNSLFMLLSRAGAKPYLRGREGRDTSVVVGEQHVSVAIDSPANLKQDRRDFRRQEEPKDRKLRVEILGHRGLPDTKTDWEDDQNSKLEKHIREIAVAIIVSGEISYRNSIIGSHEWRIRRKVELEEELRKEKEEEQRKERERVKRLEQARIDHLLGMGDAYRQANQIRDLVSAMRPATPVTGSAFSKKDFDGWATWALSQADRIDPVVSGALVKSILAKGLSDEEALAEQN